MNWKKFWKESNTAFVVKMMLIAAIIVAGIVIGVMYWMDRYTQHGKEVMVPDVVGLYTNEADMILQTDGLHLVVIDSTYSKKVPLGTIVEQNPPADSHVKNGRGIYVVVNAKSVKQIVLPNLQDLSYRQAEAMLRSLGLQVADVEYEPSEYKDLVLDIKKDDKSLPEGSKIAEGSSVVLVVGYGVGTEQVQVPDMAGIKLKDARKILLEHKLILGGINRDEELTEDNEDLFIIYQQSVNAGQYLLEGSRIDVRASTDMEKAATSASGVNDEEDFF